MIKLYRYILFKVFFEYIYLRNKIITISNILILLNLENLNYIKELFYAINDI